jgi:NADH-quinone oxidoreductase subunit L
MGRQLFMVFFNDSRRPFSTEPHDGGVLQNLPLALLALLSIGFFYSFNPLSIEGSWLVSFLSDNSLLKQAHGTLAIPTGGLHITAIVLSLVSVLVGLGISWQYFGKKSAVITKEQSTSSSWVQGLSVNSFYLDAIYDKILVLPYQAFARFLAFVDFVIIDGIINLLGIFAVVLSKIAALVDRYIIDGIVVTIGRLSKWIGQVTRSIQGGNAQSYYFWALTGVVLILFWLFQLIEWKITF